MKNMYFYHKMYGNCKIIGFYRRIALIELKNNFERFLVADGFSIKSTKWDRGYYFKDFEDAISAYKLLAFD